MKIWKSIIGGTDEAGVHVLEKRFKTCGYSGFSGYIGCSCSRLE